MPYKVVIVDDEPLAIEVLNHYLKDEADFTVVASFTNSSEALLYLQNNHTDILFLDINMAVLTGLELVKKLKKEPIIIFTTAHKQYLQDGFDLGVLDYLQKPVKKDRFSIALNRVRKELQENNKAKAGNQIYIKTTQKEFYINTDNILFIKALKSYSIIFLTDDTKVMAFGTLKSFIESNELKSSFIRIHKSYIIPVNLVKEIYSGGIIKIKNHKIPIGRKYKKDVLERFKKNEGINKSY